MRSFGGEGGGVTKRSHWITGGRGGGQDGPKKDHIIFERSLDCYVYDMKIDVQKNFIFKSSQAEG